MIKQLGKGVIRLIPILGMLCSWTAIKVGEKTPINIFFFFLSIIAFVLVYSMADSQTKDKEKKE